MRTRGPRGSLGWPPPRRPTDAAPARRGPAGSTLAMVVNLAYPENAEMVAVTQERAAEASCFLVVADATVFIRRRAAYERLLVERQLAGLLIASFLPTDGSIAALARHGRPLVLVNRRVPSVATSVASDDEAGMRVAVEHLAALGHRRIGYLAGPSPADTVHRRLAGFERAMELVGLPVDPQAIVRSTGEPDGPGRAMHRLLAADPRPTAVVLWALGDAAAALAAARALGLRMPGDLSVVGFTDAPVAAYLDPPLTTVRMPLVEVAEAGIGQLCRAVAGARGAGDVLIRTPPCLVERSSSAPPSGGQ